MSIIQSSIYIFHETHLYNCSMFIIILSAYIYKKFRECIIKNYRNYNTSQENILKIETIYHFFVPLGYLEKTRMRK